MSRATKTPKSAMIDTWNVDPLPAVAVLALDLRPNDGEIPLFQGVS